MRRFEVALTADFLRPDGSTVVPDLGLSLLEGMPGVHHRFLDDRGPILGPGQLSGVHAAIVLSPRVAATSLTDADDLLLIARFGVGTDSVDLDACTDAGVIVTITPEAVGRSMALAAITLLLAVSHRLVIKDRLARDGRWAERAEHFGTAPTGQTLGIIGLGRVGREVARLGSAFGMRPVAVDPAVTGSDPMPGIELTDLPDLLAKSDVVIVCCPLTPETFHLIDDAAIERMKPTAILINVARGPIVDQTALTRALATDRLRGAGLDVFEHEPLASDDPLTRLDNVILAPHSLGWTNEGFRDNGRSAVQAVLDIASGKVPRHVANPEVLAHERVKALQSAPAAEGLV